MNAKEPITVRLADHLLVPTPLVLILVPVTLGILELERPAQAKTPFIFFACYFEWLISFFLSFFLSICSFFLFLLAPQISMNVKEPIAVRLVEPPPARTPLALILVPVTLVILGMELLALVSSFFFSSFLLFLVALFLCV